MSEKQQSENLEEGRDKIKLMVVTGTRPEIIKVSVLIRLALENPKFHLIFVHSGQHYDENMYNVFLKELELPVPNYNLEVGSLPNSVQTARMIEGLYGIVKKENPHIIVAQGDTNTVLSAAITAFKTNIPFCHIEAGIRSYDLRMPEEVNRKLTGVCTLLNFAPTERAVQNLLSEGIDPSRIYLTGNTVVDAVLFNSKIAERKSKILEELQIEEGERYILFTAHRPSNVDNKDPLKRIIDSLTYLSEKYNIRIVAPLHPRTVKRLNEFGLFNSVNGDKNIQIIPPVGYLDFLKLMAHSYFLLTDSGGLQEESVVLKKPCLVLRENTGRPEAIEVGSSRLVGNDYDKIIKYSSLLIEDQDFYASMVPDKNPFGDGKASELILRIIQSHYTNKTLSIPYIEFDNKVPRMRLLLVKPDFIGLKVKDIQRKFELKIQEIFDKDGNILFPEEELVIDDNIFAFKIFELREINH